LGKTNDGGIEHNWRQKILNNADLTDAVGEGIINAEQVQQLQAFSDRLNSDSENQLLRELDTLDEPFRLLRGYRDVFIALGLLFFCMGATSLYSYTMLVPSAGSLRFELWQSQESSVIGSIAGVLVLLLFGIAMAEIVTRKLRLPLTSLVLSIAMTLWFAWLGLLLLAV